MPCPPARITLRTPTLILPEAVQTCQHHMKVSSVQTAAVQGLLHPRDDMACTPLQTLGLPMEKWCEMCGFLQHVMLCFTCAATQLPIATLPTAPATPFETQQTQKTTKRHESMARATALAVALALACAAVGLAVHLHRHLQQASWLVQLLPQAQMKSAQTQFLDASKTDHRLAEAMGRELVTEDRDAATAQQKLLRDQGRLATINRRLKKEHSLPLHLHRATYDVDLNSAGVRQLSGAFRSEDWPRGLDGSGAFDFANVKLSPVRGPRESLRPAANRSRVCPHADYDARPACAAAHPHAAHTARCCAGGDAIEDVLSTQGSNHDMSASQRWASRTLARMQQTR